MANLPLSPIGITDTMNDLVARVQSVVTVLNTNEDIKSYNTQSGIYNIMHFGAVRTPGVDNRKAIQSAIDACAADGNAGLVYIPGKFDVDGTLNVTVPTASGMAIAGNVQLSSGLHQLASGNVDLITCGLNDQAACTYLTMHALRLTGNLVNPGGKLIRLNNVLTSSFTYLTLEGGDYGVYGEGQNEGLLLYRLNIIAPELGGILFGAVNSGTPMADLNFPELQKAVFDHIRIFATDNGPAMRITAGLWANAQIASGWNTIRNIRLESNRRDGLVLEYCYETDVSQVSSEDHPAANNTYTMFSVYTGTVYAESINPGTSGTPNQYKHLVSCTSGILKLSKCQFGELSASAQIYCNMGLYLQDCIIRSAADIEFDGGVNAYGRCMFINILDFSGDPIEFGPEIPHFGRDVGEVGQHAYSRSLRMGNVRLSGVTMIGAQWVDNAGCGASGPLLHFGDVGTEPDVPPPANSCIVWCKGGVLKSWSTAHGIVVLN